MLKISKSSLIDKILSNVKSSLLKTLILPFLYFKNKFLMYKNKVLSLCKKYTIN